MYTAMIPYEQPTITAKVTTSRASAASITLYDLIYAIQELLAPYEDALVVNVVAYLFGSGYMTFEGDARSHEVSTN